MLYAKSAQAPGTNSTGTIIGCVREKRSTRSLRNIRGESGDSRIRRKLRITTPKVRTTPPIGKRVATYRPAAPNELEKRD
jgi:hypothetical protein